MRESRVQSWQKKFVLGCVISPLRQQAESRNLGHTPRTYARGLGDALLIARELFRLLNHNISQKERGRRNHWSKSGPGRRRRGCSVIALSPPLRSIHFLPAGAASPRPLAIALLLWLGEIWDASIYGGLISPDTFNWELQDISE